MTWPEKYLPFTTVFFLGSFANDFIPFMAMSSQSLCVTCFSFPSNDVSFDFFFLFLWVFNIHSSLWVWKSFGAALIFVWSIQSHFSCFPFFFARKKRRSIFLQDIPATTQHRKKYANCSGTKKREFCHVVLLCLAFDNGTKCWNSFCQGNFAIHDDDNVPSFLSFPLFYAIAIWKYFQSFFESFSVVSCSLSSSSSFVQN